MTLLVSRNLITKIALFYLSCFLCLNYNYGETIKSDEVNSYLEKISNTMWDLVTNYGLSNLPVPDYQLNYKVENCFGYNLNGTLYLDEGFAFDFSKFLVDKRKTRISTLPVKEPTYVSLEGEIEIKNMQIFQDFRFESKIPLNYSDKANGSVIIEPDIFSFSLKINKTFPSEEVTASVDNLSDTKPAIQFYPDNGLSQRLRKMYMNQAGQSDKQVDTTENYQNSSVSGIRKKFGTRKVPKKPYKPVKFVLSDLTEAWKPVFDKFLKEAIKQIKFPKVQF